MASSGDIQQAAALSRALRRAGWNPVSSDSPRRYDAGLTVRRGSCGLGATVCLSSENVRTLTEWTAAMSQVLEGLGYAFECTEQAQDGAVWFRRIKKTEKIREEGS